MNRKPLSCIAWKLAAALWLMAINAAPAQTSVQAWVQRYSNSVGANDSAQKVVTDNVGNVIVAGYTDNGIIGADFVIIKYSGAGAPLWTNRYNGPGNGHDFVHALAVDGDGKVFVTGDSLSGSSDTYTTVAYSGAGVPLWTNRFNGSANSLAVDSSGNVFVAGFSIGELNDNYATIKYSGAGVPLWTNRYNGTGNSGDYAYAVAVDGSGNVFVTGASVGSGGDYDYATVAYSGAGMALWTNRYSGPGNGYDQASALAVDGSGNVLVTGHSAGTNDILSPNFDYATVAYSGEGVPLWTNRFNGPGNNDDESIAVAVDSSGNVFVTGSSIGSDGDRGYATIKYSGAGVPLWTNRSGESVATGLALDSSGNALVTGFSAGSDGFSDYATIKYSGTGVPLWTNRYNGASNGGDKANAVAVDDKGNVFVTGYSSSDYATVAYSGVGVSLWTNRYDGPGNGENAASSLVVDSSGNVVVTGQSWSFGSNENVTIKYSPAGVPLWTNFYNGWSIDVEFAARVAVDSSDNVFVAGSSDGPFNSYVTIKFSNAGVPLWTNRYNGPENYSDRAIALAVDGGGNAFVTGSSGGLFNIDYATIKYSGAGVPLWTNRYNGPVNGNDRAAAVVVDGGGNVFVTGSSAGSGSDYDYATVAYSGAGVALWTNRYNAPGNGYDIVKAMAVDGARNVFVTGHSASTNDISSSNHDYATVAYSGPGIPLWTNRYNGPGNGYDLANAVAVDSSGNVFVTGASLGSEGSSDYATIKYSGAGVPLWTNRYDGPGKGADEASAVAVDSGGNVFVTGYSWSGSSYDYTTVEYSGSGVPLWTNRYNGPANGDDVPRGNSCLAISPDGAVYVAGGSDGDYTLGARSDYATIKYSIAALSLISLKYQIVGSQLVLSWTNASFSLQSAPAVTGMFTNISGAASPYTNVVSDTQQYFRLKGN